MLSSVSLYSTQGSQKFKVNENAVFGHQLKRFCCKVAKLEAIFFVNYFKIEAFSEIKMDETSVSPKDLHFSIVDYAAFTLLLVLSAIIGIYYGFVSKKKQNTTAEYLLGGQKMTLLPIAISLIVSYGCILISFFFLSKKKDRDSNHVIFLYFQTHFGTNNAWNTYRDIRVWNPILDFFRVDFGGRNPKILHF